MTKEIKFEDVYEINVSEKTEEKGGLTYLSWAWAWKEFKTIYPNATYRILRFGDNDLPYVKDSTGYMVFTEVTVGNITHEMWLPVMDSKNKSMKEDGYEYTTKYGTGSVEPATMFDINKTIMRCLTKNLAMFGLGLYIYAGEDLPEVREEIWKERINNIKTLDEGRAYWTANVQMGNSHKEYLTAKMEELKKQEKKSNKNKKK